MIPGFEQTENQLDALTGRGDLISRQAAIDFVGSMEMCDEISAEAYKKLTNYFEDMPSAQPEPLTDKEQRIFLAAMAREEKVCEEVDRNYVREPYEDSLMSVCREIKRKVKGALWT